MKTVLITHGSVSHWQSCRAITAGLTRAYRALPPGTSLLERSVSNLMSDAAVFELAHEILARKPQVIAFLDTWPAYGRLLAALAKLAPERNRPVLRFHAYGDFTVLSARWVAWALSLKGFRCEWACASESQRELISHFIPQADRCAWVCPFPVETERFVFSESERRIARKRLGVKPGERIVLYSGRLSLQKNVLANLAALRLLRRDTLERLWFYFLGNFDDLSPPFDETYLPDGGFYQLWKKELDSLPRSLARRIRVIPGISREGLRSIYQAADVFLSLSLVHDEDYGMAPAEAAVSGLPLILTGWGGYLGFRSLGMPGEWIPVDFDERSGGPSFDLARVTAALERAQRARASNSERFKRSLKNARKVSIRAASARIASRGAVSIRSIPVFTGFLPEMTELTGLFHPGRACVVYSDSRRGSFYEKIYRNYLGIQSAVAE